MARLLWICLLLVSGCARRGVPGLPERDAGADVRDAGPVGGLAACQALAPGACDPDARPSVYVSTAGDDARSGRSPSEAVLTLAVALDRASRCSDGPCNIRIAQGTYEGSFALVGGVDLYGGFAPDFRTRDPSEHPVILTSKENRTVLADGLTGPVLLDAVTIQGADLDTLDGRSSHALWVRGLAEQLTVMRSTLVAGGGADGAPGADGVLGSCTPQPGIGGEASDCAASDGLGGGAGVDPQQGGAGGVAGDSNCPSVCPLIGRDGIRDGASGSPGEPGADGDRGLAAPEVRGSFESGDWRGPVGAPGGRGKHGTGGGGGGAGGSKRFRACFSCDTLIGGRGGDGGAGGCGGGGGSQGQAGGGAFALTVVDATVFLEDSLLRGGRGGAGGAGGKGSDGAPGSPADDSLRSDGPGQRCGAIDYSAGHGGAGAPGGAGGSGGGGAGGAGGAAITLLLAGEGAIERVGDVTAQPGEAGVGGAGGASSGARGETGKPGLVAPEAAF